MINFAPGYSPDDEEFKELYDSLENPPLAEITPEEVTHTLEVHGDICILVPIGTQITNVEELLKSLYSVPDKYIIKENDFMYRASIKIGHIPTVIYYFELPHLSSSEREKFVLDTMTELLQSDDLSDDALVI